MTSNDGGIVMKLILLGAPGAGKGTQAKLIANHFGIPHISTGDIFRANIKNGTELGIKAKEYMDKGALVPDELTVDLVLDTLSSPECSGGYVLDGFPRTINQAEALDAALAKKGDAIDSVIDIEVDDEAIIERMSGRRVCPACGASFHVVNIPPAKEGICDACGAQLIIRKDDEPETVKARLATYHKQTQPLIGYYTERGKNVRIDGMQDMGSVFDQIKEKLAK